MAKTYLLLGGNQEDRIKYLEEAVQLIAQNVGSVLHKSSYYESEPWGFKDQNYFINQVVEVQTELMPGELLDKIQKIEKKLGRIRDKNGYSSRTIDIDILFYDDLVFDSPRLHIPHKLLHKRMFTLAPLNEVLPLFTHPELKVTIQDLYLQCDDPFYVAKLED